MTSPGSSEDRGKGGLARWFGRIGWTVGFLFSLVLPQMFAPLNPTLPFRFGAVFSAIAGFTIMYEIVRRTGMITRTLSIVCALFVTIIAGGWYRTLLFAVENTTPSKPVEWFELLLFCTTFFCAAAVLAYAYFGGARWLLQRFGKFTVS